MSVEVIDRLWLYSDPLYYSNQLLDEDAVVTDQHQMIGIEVAAIEPGLGQAQQ